MKYTLLVYLIFLASSPLFAQNKDLDEQDMKAWQRGADLVRTKVGPRNVDGDPFYNDHWQKGYVLLNDTAKSEPVKLKFDTYNNRLLFQKDQKVMEVTSKHIKGFMLKAKNQTTLFENGFNSPDNHINPSLYLRIIYGGNTKLVVKHYTKLHKATTPNPLTGETTDKFLSKKDYYLITDDGQFQEINLKRSDILDVLNDHKRKLKKYAESNDFDFGNENDLKKIFHYYDRLESVSQ